MAPHFFGLPAEIRTSIYSYAITISRCKVQLNVHSATDEYGNDWYLQTTEPEQGGRRRRGRPVFQITNPIALALHRVSLQVRAESLQFLPQIRLYIEFEEVMNLPDDRNAYEMLSRFGACLEGMPSRSLVRLVKAVTEITIGTLVVEQFLESFCCHDERFTDGYHQAWLQLNEPWFFPNLEKVIIYDDGRFGYGPHQMSYLMDDPVEPRKEERGAADWRVSEGPWRIQNEANAYLFQRDDSGPRPDGEGVCLKLDVPQRKFRIIYQTFFYDYKWLWIEMPPGQGPIEHPQDRDEHQIVDPEWALEQGGINVAEWGVPIGTR